MLNLSDEFTRECLAIRMDVLSDQFILRSVPCHIRSDRGPEFVTAAVRNWIAAVAAGLPNIERSVGLAGLDAKPQSRGGKEWLGSISKMGNRHIRRRLYLRAMSVIPARRKAELGDDRLERLIGTRPLKVAPLALATAWHARSGPWLEDGRVLPAGMRRQNCRPVPV